MLSETVVNNILQANAVTLALIFAITIGITLILLARGIQPLLRMLLDLSRQFTEQNDLLAKAVQQNHVISAQLAQHLEEYTRKTDQQIQTLRLQGQLIDGNQHTLQTLQEAMAETVDKLPGQLRNEIVSLQAFLKEMDARMISRFDELGTELDSLSNELNTQRSQPDKAAVDAIGKDIDHE